MEDSYRIDRDYILTRESLRDGGIEFRGMSGNSKLVYYAPQSDWRILSIRNESLDTIFAIYNGTKTFPIGLLDWFAFGICTDNPNKTFSMPLKLSMVSILLQIWSANSNRQTLIIKKL